ncbi:MAG: NBR1-Ig-like domain-containing protein [Chloroflexota bacterium]
MRRQPSLPAAIAGLTAAGLACNLPFFAPTTPPAAATLGQLYTAAARTLAAADSQAGSSTPTATATGAFPTFASLMSTGTPAPVALCDAAAFVRDVTIPDGATVDPGGEFTKTWRLLNVGTCSWTPSYALVFVSGDRMHAPTSAGLPGNINPGQTVDVSLRMSAPFNNGEYQGYWRLRNAAGASFGIGAQAQGAFWVKIRVAGPSYSAYDFARAYCDAVWENNNRELPCPGSEGDGKGYVIEVEDAVLENGNAQDDPGLLTVPRDAYNGVITGQYPAVKIRDGDHFKAGVNCAHKAFSCNVVFSVYYQIGGGSVKSLGHWNEAYEGKFYSIDLDLSSLAGSNVKFILSVSSNGPFNQDRGLWIGPRISRIGSPPSTATPTSTFTATLTATGTPSSTPTLTPPPTGTPSPTATP